MSKTVLFQTIQFTISTKFSSIWGIDRTLSGATTLGQSGPGSDGNEGVLHIPQTFSITVILPLDCSVSYPGHSLVGVLPLYRKAVGVFYSPCQLGKKCNNNNYLLMKLVFFQVIIWFQLTNYKF